MEKNSSEALATESFSYSWLIHKSSDDDDDDENPRRIEEEDKLFHFDVTTSPADHLVTADEIFSHGRIMPVYAARSTSVNTTTVNSVDASSPPSRTTPFLDGKLKRCCIIGKWRRTSKKILHKCLGFVKNVGCSRKRNRVDDLERKVFEHRSFANSLEASPRRSSTHSVVEYCGDHLEINSAAHNNWRSLSLSSSSTPFRSNNYVSDENSIYEAVLFCKRSIEK